MKKKFKILFIIWCVLVLVFLVLTLNPYIYFYNRGNEYYQLGAYEQAADSYQMALTFPIPQGRECDVRVNLVLARTKPLTKESVTDENIDEYINILQDCRNILLEKGCAKDGDEEGHDKEAQQLKEDIDDYIAYLEQLKNQSSQDSQNQQNSNSNQNSEDQQSGQNQQNEQNPPDSQDPQNSENDPDDQQQTENPNNSQLPNYVGSGEGPEDEPNETDDVEEKLDDLQKEAQNERNRSLNSSQYWDDYDYYDGECW